MARLLRLRRGYLQRIEVKLLLTKIDDGAVGSQNVHPEQADHFAVSAVVESESPDAQIGRAHIDPGNPERLQTSQLCRRLHPGSVNTRGAGSVSFSFHLRNETLVHSGQSSAGVQEHHAGGAVNLSTHQTVSFDNREWNFGQPLGLHGRPDHGPASRAWRTQRK